MIGSGFGPGGRGKEDDDLRRVIMYTPASNPNMARNVVECMFIRIGRIANQIQSVGDGSGFITGFPVGSRFASSRELIVNTEGATCREAAQLLRYIQLKIRDRGLGLLSFQEDATCYHVASFNPVGQQTVGLRGPMDMGPNSYKDYDLFVSDTLTLCP